MGRSKWIWPLSYLATIVAANWLLETFGFVSVGFGLLAPAGVYCAGLAYQRMTREEAA